MKKITPAMCFLSKKRSKKNSQRIAKEKLGNNKKKYNKLGVKNKYHSKILDSLNIGFGISKVNRSHRFQLNIPSKFSIIDNPQESLEIVREFVRKVRSGSRITHMTINHKNVKANDLAAETIIGYCAYEFNREKRYKIDIRGIFPDDLYLNKYIRATGIIKHLNVRHEYLDKEEEQKLKIFRKTNGRHTQQDDVGNSDFKENTSTEFARHIDECLESMKRKLTQKGVKILTAYIGEILGNAEEHPVINQWAIYGYLDDSKDGSNICEIAIFNFGGSIADSFRSLNKDGYAYQQVAPYIEKHQSNGFFNEAWTEDALLTLVALQGDISSKNIDSTTDRGQGTIDAINFFQEISQECKKNEKSSAKMAILSGSTHILFDGTYGLQEDRNGRKVIAFNKENSLENRPDSKYIKTLKNINFPGTVISIRFPLEKTDTFIQ